MHTSHIVITYWKPQSRAASKSSFHNIIKIHCGRQLRKAVKAHHNGLPVTHKQTDTRLSFPFLEGKLAAVPVSRSQA